jgi:NADP-dependent 3-hydroxy acid dehydrogenase YdfG
MEKINESVVLITGGTSSFGVAFLEKLIDHEEYVYSFMKHNHYIINGLKQTLTNEPIKPFSSENQQLNIQEIIHLIQQSMTQK